MSSPSITCTRCRAKSYNANDIRNLYCGRCHRFHERTSDYELDPPIDRSGTAENFGLMSSACQVWLTPAQREIIAQALESRPNALTNGLSNYSGRVLHPKRFAEIFYELAVKAKELPEDEQPKE